jgi:thiol-disulfide isomerase/thioredoxin
MSFAAAGLIGIAPALAGAQQLPPAKSLLELQQSIKGVEYETPTGAAAAACKVELVYDATKKHAVGYALRDGQGKLLRRFFDSNASGKMNQWSYYQDGFEVYRESDLNGDGSPDEARWLNTAGTRTAAIAGGKIKSWKRISAEEASKVFVQGLVSGDLNLIETVLAKPEELEALGVPKAELERVAQAASKRVEQVNTLVKSLAGWNDKTVWSRLDGMMPHLVPADPAAGITSDLLLYENAVIFAAPPNGQGNVAKMAFLQAPDMIKLGETWKFIELPRAVDPEKPIVAAEGGLRAILAGGDQPAGRTEMSPEMDAALKALAAYTQENAGLLGAGDKKDIARYHVNMIPLLRNVVKAARSADDKLLYNKQIADSLAAAYQTGAYPKGGELLDALGAEGGKIAPYAALRKISAVFALSNEENGNAALANQKKWMADLKEFAEKFPKADETPDALFQLAQGYEFNAEEDEARKYYAQIAQDFPSSDAAKKAAGALRRLDLVGKSIALRGPALDGQEVSAAQFKGKTLLVVFWATWAEPVKRDLPEIAKLYQKNRDKGFAVLGVNLDNDRKDVDAFLKSNPLPWSQIHEKDGMDSRLATEYGIISLPTMFLVDPKGNVINRNVRSAADLERQLEKSLGENGNGVALGARERAANVR